MDSVAVAFCMAILRHQQTSIDQMPCICDTAQKHGKCGYVGDVLGYAEQVTKCCNCSAFIKVFDAANHCIYTLEGRAYLRPHRVVRQPTRIFIFSHVQYSEGLNTPMKCS